MDIRIGMNAMAHGTMISDPVESTTVNDGTIHAKRIEERNHAEECQQKIPLIVTTKVDTEGTGMTTKVPGVVV